MEPEKAWKPVVPVPHDAPEPNLNHGQYSAPTAVYKYTTGGGQLYSYICRFVDKDGKKQVRPRTYGYLNEKLGWHWKGAPERRPLYNAKALADNPHSTVLVVEGEKTADLCMELLPELVVVTSMFGCQAPKGTDWSPMKQREIVIWPDNDEPGMRYKNQVIRFALDSGARKIRVVELPGCLPPKWDLADPMPAGFSLEKVRELIVTAPVVEEALGTESVPLDDAARAVRPPFKLTSDAVEMEVEEGKDCWAWKTICDRLGVVAYTRDGSSTSWGRLLEFKDHDGVIHQWAMPAATLAGGTAAMLEFLLDSGLCINPERFARDGLARYILTCKPERRLVCVNRGGWHDKSFVLGETVLGGDPLVLQGGAKVQHTFRISGTIEDWNKYIGDLLPGNDRLVLAVAAAFAASLIGVVSGESGGIHYRGASSIGKSTALLVAGSVWGGGGVKGYARQWRATSNGLEGVAALHCDTLLALDEIGQATAQDVGISYTCSQIMGAKVAQLALAARATLLNGACC